MGVVIELMGVVVVVIEVMVVVVVIAVINCFFSHFFLIKVTAR